ncbi:hypothetical protein DXG01_010169 [Tephrocybe rancida]|nr:hypothetical protein DXG01_010169 [Tephrocybe rancida]
MSIPRLRVSRNSHAYDNLLSGSSLDYLPDPSSGATTAPVDDSDSNDRDDDQESTPKMTSMATLRDPFETPAARLRAVMARTPGSSKTTPMPLPPSQPSDNESDFEPPNATYETTHSSAKESLKDIFSRALRDPGNTPQKVKTKPRRNSIDTSEVEASPRVQRQRAQNKSNRRTLSDEEIDPINSSEASFRSSQAAKFDTLRERLTDSHTQLKDSHFHNFVYDQHDSDNDAATFLRSTNISTSTPPVATSTPQPSLRMSIDSHLPSQSNLLDQDSEMQRAFEGFDSYEAERSGQHPVSSPPSLTTAREPHRRPTSRQANLSQPGSRGTHGNDSEQFRDREKEWNRPRTPALAHTPDLSRHSPHLQFPRSGSPLVGVSSSGNLLRRESSTSLHSLGESSSKGSSYGSQADYRERVAELERERNIERERDWNKPRASSSRPTSSLGFQPTVAAERSRTRSLIQADSPLLSPSHHRQRLHSLNDSSRASSPANSSHGSQHEEEEEVVHERERNWNAPRPIWSHSSPRPASPLKTQSPSVTGKGTGRGQSATPRNHNVNGDANGSGPTPSAPRSASPLPFSRPSLSPLSSRHDYSYSQRQNGPTAPRSPSPSISSKTFKGKGKAVDQSMHSQSPVNFASRDSLHSSSSMTKQSLSPGFSFVKNRTPLAPIELEKETPERKSASHRTGPSPSPVERPASRISGSVKPSGIPVRSPQKSKPSTKSSMQSESPVPTATLDFFRSDAEDSVQERTPTLKRVPALPPLNTPEYTPPRSPSPPHSRSEKANQNESSLQQNPKSNNITAAQEETTKTPDQSLFQKLSPPPSPVIPLHRRDSEAGPASFLSTPPRRSSFNTSKLEFQTPSPPKNMPDLPGPPTSSEDGTDEESGRASSSTLRRDLTALKTPRPPGAWAPAPAPSRPTARPSLSKADPEQATPSGRPRTPTRDFGNLTTAKTPRPPGAWASTPTPHVHHDLPSEDVSGDTEPDYESGLATPVASFSKGSSLPSQTPAPPGAWAATPAARKSILKVRFDAANESAATGSTTRDPLEDITNGSRQRDFTPSRSRTPEPTTPVSPVSRRTTPHKSPGIRVLDAFGRVVVKDEVNTNKAANTSKNKSGIRVVDAIGREVGNVDEPSQLTNGDVSELAAPQNRDEALGRVRQGLADLADGLDELDQLEQDNPIDYSRLRKLQKESAKARTARDQVGAALVSNTADLNSKLEPFRKSLKKNRLFLPSSGRHYQASWTIFFVLFAQAFIFFIMYRLATSRAQDLFLTTYYDPFYPDIHLYTSRPDTLRLSVDDSLEVSWLSIPDIFHREVSAEQSCSHLQDLINTTDQLAHSLGVYSSTSFSTPKIFSLLRQHLKVDDTLHQSDHRIHELVEALRARPSISYGEDIPLNPNAIVDWCIGRLESWGTSAGMETFKDDGRQGSISVVLGGKVVVVDVDFSIDTADPTKPRITVSSVKTSYAITSSDGTTSNSEGSVSLDGFIRDNIKNFCNEVQKPEGKRNLEEAARLGVAVAEQLQYIVTLDRLAARRDDGGLQWFKGLDKLCPILEDFAASEAEAVASSLSLPKAPLDIFLLRSHALPLPFLISPSVSFLVHLSPQAYLKLLNATETPSSSWDISLSSLRTHMLSIPKGVAIATLSLTIAHSGQIFPATMNMPTFTARPTFPLAPQGSELEHTFPQTRDPSTAMIVPEDLDTGKQYTWILDFTNGEKNLGIVMSQSRMREIELIVNPLGGVDTMETVTMMSFSTGSWVDLLLNPVADVSPERYTALYTSPTSLHPPLQLRLTAPQETGFRLDKVPVHNMKEVWGIMEVVREQCWLNEILSGCHWTAEDLRTNVDELSKETEATEDELQAVLNGSYRDPVHICADHCITGNLPPRKIPVNIFLPTQNIATDALFATPDIDGMSIPQLQPRRPRIMMTSPERLPIPGFVEIAVIYDESRPRGVAVEISGAMSSDIQIDVLEEICRRGGTLGLSGRVWSRAS